RYGLVGTAIASLGSVTLLHALVLIEVRSIHGVHPFAWSVFKPFVAAAVALAVESLIARWCGQTVLRVPGLIAGGLFTYLLVLRVLGLDPEDRRLIDGLVVRLRRWLGRT
ncbi:MAG: hypothetical protein H7X95_03095, partial [Deltaproteobacteria bacterium]|nr:hypothetical protein [Deltaproteobacteria bacterium]